MGSLASSCSSLDDLDDIDPCRDIPEVMTPPPQPEGPLAVYEPEEARIVTFPQDFVHYPGAMAEPVLQQPMPIAPPQASLASKFYQSNTVWDWVGKQAMLPSIPHHPVAFHHQVPLFTLQGFC